MWWATGPPSGQLGWFSAGKMERRGYQSSMGLGEKEPTEGDPARACFLVDYGSSHLDLGRLHENLGLLTVATHSFCQLPGSCWPERRFWWLAFHQGQNRNVGSATNSNTFPFNLLPCGYLGDLLSHNKSLMVTGCPLQLPEHMATFYGNLTSFLIHCSFSSCEYF